MRGEGQDKDQVNQRIETKLAMSRRPPQALPPGDSNNKESEQEDVSSEAKQKVQKIIMTFFKKKPKKHGRGCSPKETTPPPQLAKKQKDEEAGKPAKKQHVGDAKKYINYSDPVEASTLKEAANHYYKTGKYLTLEDCMISNKPLISIPRGTVHLAAKAIQQSNLTNDAKPPAWLNSGGSTMTTSDGWSLMSEPMRAFIAGIAKCCDETQIGMSRKEVIQLMKLLTLATTMQCDNHFDYLVRMKKMPELKNHGRVQRAQAMMTKRSCIQLEQQLQWLKLRVLGGSSNN
jgi:hypothetical protein